jgi:hypothetical protein
VGGHHDQDQLVHHVGLHDEAVILHDPPSHEGKIHFISQDPQAHLPAVGDFQVDRDLGIPPAKFPDDPGEEVVSRSRARSNRQLSPLDTPELPQALLQLSELGEDPQGVLLYKPPRLREGDSLPRAVEEGLPHLLLELANVEGKGRLTHVELLGRPGEAPVPGHSQKDLELLKGHRFITVLAR